MSRPMHQPAIDSASALQRVASNPRTSVWVSADAGTGKTEVLTQRVLRLLLDDPMLVPSSILALTFTKAGASEMALRLPNPRRASDRRPWLQLSDDELRAEVRVLLERDISDADLARARDLPRVMAEHPPWVTTIHGFCQQVLARFPHEAGVPEGFDVLDDVGQAELLRHASQHALEQSDGAVAEALRWLLGRMADSSLSTLTDMLVRDWSRLRDVVAQRDVLAVNLRDKLQVGDGVPQGFALSAADVSTLRAWADTLRVGGKTDKELAVEVDTVTARHLTTWHAAGEALKAIFLTQKLAPTTRLGTKDVKAALGAVWDDVLNLQARVHEQVSAERRWVVYKMTLDVLVWAGSVADRYSAMKRERGALDFADLIHFTEQLLLKNTEGWRDWVMYRLDRNIKHLMVDESQDNSPTQANLVELLARELLSGDVGEDHPRTVFAVGDVKQSIYRFQGAAPELFVRLSDVLREYPGTEVTGLSHSFRTSSAVLDTVNDVFAGIEGRILRGGDATDIAHKTVMPEAYGRVELWPLLEAEDAPDVAPWTPPDARVQREAGPLRVGRAVGHEIAAMVRDGVVLDATGKACRYGDFMLLTQRNEAAAQVLAALRGCGIPAVMTGSDDELPMLCSDLLALLRALWNGADALALAQVVKSPLVGWDDAQVLAWRLACKRMTPWDAVADVDTRIGTWLKLWRDRLQRWTLYRLLVTLVREHGVVARYGDERGLDVLLDAALQDDHVLRLLVRHEQGGLKLPKLAGSHGNRVRVMTVHQSKGLEAPVVFLVDTTRKATARNSQREKLLFDMPVNGVLEGVLFWGSDGDGGAYQDALVVAEEGRKLADSYRLLYVAMTRAKERLVVCGWHGKRDGDGLSDDGLPLTWYAALKRACEQQTGNWRQDGERWVRESGKAAVADAVVEHAVAVTAIPAWVNEVRTPAEDVALAPALSAEQQAAVDYGTLVHRLLAVLPADDEARVRAVAESWVTREVDAALRENVLAEAMAVWRAVPEVFAAGSRAEVPIGLQGGKVGRIDRLVVRDDAVWIIDFKTERVVPDSVPAGYRSQLDAYAAAMRTVWPALPVRCAIVWVAGPRLAWLN